MSAAREARKTVTILFCDLVHSTGLAEGDPEAYRRVQSRYFDEMRGIVERHGGTVEKFIGDEVMAVFGVPIAHEDDALRAVRTAQAMQQALPGLGLEARIGINTGEVLVGDPDASHGFLAGEPVIVAKRLEQGAQSGEIIIGKATLPLVKDAVSAGPLERISVKGKSDEVGRHRIDDVHPEAPGVARRLHAPIVGRDEELALLRAAFDRAVEERSCRLFTILGTAGIGKSRLAAELMSSLADGATCAVGRCLPYGEGITYWPLSEVARSLGDAEMQAALEQGSTEDIFLSVRRACEATAHTRPLLLCFEDLHWAEPTFLDLVEYVSGWSRDAPILILALARPELVERRPNWIAPQPNADALALEPLSVPEAESLLARLSDDLELPATAWEQIAEAAEGNPLFLEQMAAMASENGDGDMATPSSIQALLAERLDRLTAPERDVLERASVIGRDFPVPALAGLAGEDTRDSLTQHLLSLARKGLIEPAPAHDEDRFSFQHVLVRDAAYEAMPKQLRAELHERLAGTEGQGDELVGYHLEQAARFRVELGEPDDSLAKRAAEHLAAAGRRAAAREDIPAALNLLERANVLLSDGDELRGSLLLDIGSLMMSAGRWDDAPATLADALSNAQDRSLVLRIQLEQALLGVFTEERYEEAAALAAEALPELEELGDDQGLAKSWMVRSEEAVAACRWGTRQEMLDRALVHARRAGDRRLVSNLAGSLCFALLLGPAPVAEAITRCEELLAETRLGALSVLAGLRAMQGEFALAREQWAEARAGYEELGLRFRRATRSLIGAQVERLAGDPNAAVEELRFGESELEDMGERGVRSALAAYLADVLCEAGRFDEAYEASERSESLVEENDIGTEAVWRYARAKVLAERGEMEEAEALSVEAERLAEPTEFPDLRAGALLGRAHVLSRAGREDEAKERVQQAIAAFEAKGNIVAARQVGALLSDPV